MDSKPPETLKKQFELVRFERALEYIKQSAGGKKRLNSQELGQVNNLITNSSGNPWRQEATNVRLPTGRSETLSLISNPMFAARDLLSAAFERSLNGEVE